LLRYFQTRSQHTLATPDLPDCATGAYGTRREDGICMAFVAALGLCCGFFALYWVALVWLRRHGGVTPLRLWPVYIVLSALLGGDVALMAQPFDLGLFVVLVVSMGSSLQLRPLRRSNINR
jgi:hypothetical protein